MKIFVGITGASGQIYGGRLLRALHSGGHEVTACFSNGSIEVIRAEDLAGAGLEGASREEVINAFLDSHGLAGEDIASAAPDDMSSPFASGSFLAAASIICPCSMSSLASIACGVTRHLVHRVADVMLKEGRPLVIVPRETPLGEIHLRNMLRLKQAGARMVPAMPAFYHRPRNVDGLADFMAGKIMDSLGIGHDLFQRWNGLEGNER
ncbi:MAG: UbiX family flavin prenyltransferase [Thermoleophilia bacterium]|nr:UbiX family flavin prenyltransferase [Thermoleophilia bacterium]